MTIKEAAKNAARDLDRRVRERNLASGKLEAKAVEKHLADLQDVESQCETVQIPQPAIGSGDDDGEA